MLKSAKASMGFIFITVLVDVIGFGIIIPVIPTLLEGLLGAGLSDAAWYGGLLVFSYAIMQFMFAPLLGILSDKYGRRPVLLLALLGLSIDYLIHAEAPSITWLFIGRILAGITGASYGVANAYVADISTPEKKAQNFGLIGVAFGLGFIIGPLIGGVLSEWGIAVPFYFASGMTFLNFLYGWFILPESLPPEKRSAPDWSKTNPLGSLSFLRSQRQGMLGLVVVFFMIYVSGHSLQSTWTYITMMKYDWDEAAVGYSLAFVGALVVLVQGVLVKPVVTSLGERKTVILGFTLWVSGMALFAFAENQWVLLAVLIPYCAGGVASPALQSLMSNAVPADKQGALQGGLTSLMGLSSIVGPLLMTNIFYFFSGEGDWYFFPGAPFLMSVVLIGTSMIVLIPALKRLEQVDSPPG